MKKYLIFILMLSLFLTGCSKAKIYLPVPVTLSQILHLTTDASGNFSSAFVFPAQTIAEDVQKKLSEISEYNDLNSLNIESVQVTITETNTSAATINGDIKVRYTNPSSTKLLDITNLDVGEVYLEPASIPLQQDGVDVIFNAMNDVIITNNTNADLSGILVGTASTSANSLQFSMKLEVTVTLVLEQCREVFDFFQSGDDEGCN